MIDAKIASFLGLAQKAGAVASGSVAVEKAVRSGKAKMVLVASDCSQATFKSYSDMCSYYNIPMYKVLTKSSLGKSIGKNERAVFAITDMGFSKQILKLLQQKNDWESQKMGVD